MTTINAKGITTIEAAQTLGINQGTLLQFLYRNPELRPARQLGKCGDLLWTEEELERVAAHRARRRRQTKQD